MGKFNKNMFDAEVFSKSSEEIKPDIVIEQIGSKDTSSVSSDISVNKKQKLKGKKGTYIDVLDCSFSKEDKNNISPVNIYTSIQGKISFLKILHPKMSKIDIVNSILKDFFDNYSEELNSEMVEYQSKLNSIF